MNLDQMWILRIMSYSNLSDKWYCNLSPQDFSVEKFIKDDSGNNELQSENQHKETQN